MILEEVEVVVLVVIVVCKYDFVVVVESSFRICCEMFFIFFLGIGDEVLLCVFEGMIDFVYFDFKGECWIVVDFKIDYEVIDCEVYEC